MIPQVIQVLARDDFTVYVYFLDGIIRLLDTKPLLEQGEVFAPLCDGVTFRNTPEFLRIPFYVYESSFPQFMESPLHAGAGTVTQRRCGPYVHCTGVPAAAAEFQVTIDRELNWSQDIMEQDGVHLKRLLT